MRSPATVRRRSLGASAALALLLSLLVGVPSASAAVTGSLVFIRDHDVWIAPAADPGAARPLTTDGTADRPYATPVMDAGGTVYAVTSLGNGVDGSGDIVRMDRSGQRIGAPFRPVSTGLIYSLDVSPDGRTLGFTWAQSSSSGPVFGVAAFSGFANADGSPSSYPTDLEGYQPVFYSDDRAVLVTYSEHYSTAGLSTYQLGQSEASSWFLTCQQVSSECAFPTDPDVSPSLERLAATTPPLDDIGGDNTTLVVWEMTGAPPAQPTKACEHAAATEVFEPAWSPDGDALVWEQSDGIHLAEGFDGDCASAFAGERLHLPDATWPSWSSAPAAPEPGPGGFTDTQGNVHADAIVALVEADITGGYPDGTYRPNTSVTRGQMATFLTRALDLPPGDPSRFTDVSDSAHRDSIGALVAAGITGGYPDDTFRPQESVTRGQMATFLTRALNLPPGDPSRFTDVSGTPHRDAIGSLVEAGITGGFPDGTFRPNESVTRGQMATFLVRALDL